MRPQRHQLLLLAFVKLLAQGDKKNFLATCTRGTKQYSLSLLLAIGLQNILSVKKTNKPTKDAIVLITQQTLPSGMFPQHCITALSEKKQIKCNVHNRTVLQVDL